MTLGRNIDVYGWLVRQEVTLSGHKYVHFEFELDESKRSRSERKVYDFVGTDWEVFKQRLEETKPNLNTGQDDLNKRAELMQQV